jgi:hypothetical protein
LNETSDPFSRVTIFFTIEMPPRKRAVEAISTTRRTSRRTSTTRSQYFEDSNDTEESDAPPAKKRGRPPKKQLKKEESEESYGDELAQEEPEEDDDNDDDDEEDEDAPMKVTFIPLVKLRDTEGVEYQDFKLHKNTLLFLKDLKANNQRPWLKCEYNTLVTLEPPLT